MCLGIPGEIVELLDLNGLRFAKVRFGGVSRNICLEYVEDAAVGEFVVVHVGFAISKIDREEAERSFAFLDDLGETRDLLDPGEEPR